MGGDWQLGLADQVVLHLHVDKPGGTTGEQDRPCNPGIQHKTKASKHLVVKTCEVVAVGETPSLTRESVGEAHGILECTQAHPPRNQHLKGHDPLVGSEGSD